MRFGGERAIARRRRNYTIVIGRLEAGPVVLSATQVDLQFVFVLVVVVLARRFDQPNLLTVVGVARRSVLDLRSGRPTRGGHFPTPRPDLRNVFARVRMGGG